MRVGGLKLDSKAQTVTYREGLNRDVRPVAGVTAAVESVGEDRRRVTATRVLTGGVLFGAAKKNVGGRQLFIEVDGPDFHWSVEVKRETGVGADRINRKIEAKARKLVAAINTAAKQAAV